MWFVVQEQALVVEIVRTRRVPMGRAEVIRLLESLERKPPAHVLVQRPLPENHMASQIKSSELFFHRGQPRVYVDRLILG